MKKNQLFYIFILVIVLIGFNLFLNIRCRVLTKINGKLNFLIENKNTHIKNINRSSSALQYEKQCLLQIENENRSINETQLFVNGDKTKISFRSLLVSKPILVLEMNSAKIDSTLIHIFNEQYLNINSSATFIIVINDSLSNNPRRNFPESKITFYWSNTEIARFDKNHNPHFFLVNNSKINYFFIPYNYYQIQDYFNIIITKIDGLNEQ